jgi:hypothetical protein
MKSGLIRILFVGLILRSDRWAVVGVMATALAILAWLWPRRRLGQTAEPQHV